MKDYIQIVYDKKERPITNYPDQLAKYLVDRFDIKLGDKILENGCGRGDFINAFKRLGLQCYATDISLNASEMLEDILFEKVNLENDRLPYEDDCFDIIFTKSVIEHIYKPDNFISECYRVLKPGGRIIIMTPDWQTTMHIFYDDFTHVHPYNEIAINDLLQIYNYRYVECEKFYQLPILWDKPFLKIVSRILQLTGPVKKIHKNKFYRWSKELMILGTGIK